MGEYRIVGGKSLSGEVRVGGGKNAILPILAATVLNGGNCVMHDCPKIADTFTSIEILEAIGCRTKWEASTLIVDSSTANCCEVPEKLALKMRSSFIFLGSILGRFGSAKISYPGGCQLGPRPVNLHLNALKEMGVCFKEEHGYVLAQTDKVRGAHISLDFPSVGATQNIMLAAVLAEGETVISNAAKEPEVCDVEKFLVGMGAKVKGAGTDTIVIQGVAELNDVTHVVMPDRIIAGTYLTAAAVTKGSCMLDNVNPKHMTPIIAKLREAGCKIQSTQNQIYLEAPEVIKSVKKIRTHPHPGFPTDMQPQFTVLLSVADGISIVEETIFASRTKHIDELTRMGADLTLVNGKIMVVRGVGRLTGATVEAADLRSGAALILAGLCADGQTVVAESKHVERGYESIEGDLSALGAHINYIR